MKEILKICGLLMRTSESKLPMSDCTTSDVMRAYIYANEASKQALSIVEQAKDELERRGDWEDFSAQIVEQEHESEDEDIQTEEENTAAG